MKRVRKSTKKYFDFVVTIILLFFAGTFIYIYQIEKTKPIFEIEKKEIKITKRNTVYPTLYSDKNITENAKITDYRFKNISFSGNTSLLANTISSIKKKTATTTRSAGGTEMGSWVWTPISYITPEYTKNIIYGAKMNGINTIYLSIDTFLDIYVLPDGDEKIEKKKIFDEIIENFIVEAHKNNIEVDAEAGWKNWAEPGNAYKSLAILNYVIEFNKNHENDFRGFQYDVEPYLLSEYKENKELVLRNFLNLIDKTVTELEQTDLEFSVVIPEFYDGTNYETPMFSYKGKEGFTFDHLISILDRKKGSKIIVMSYRNFSLGEDGSVDISANEILTANKHKTKVIIAQETGDVEPPYITFHKTSKRYYDKQLSIIERVFSQEKSYGGIATHYLNSFMDL